MLEKCQGRFIQILFQNVHLSPSTSRMDIRNWQHQSAVLHFPSRRGNAPLLPAGVKLETRWTGKNEWAKLARRRRVTALGGKTESKIPVGKVEEEKPRRKTSQSRGERMEEGGNGRYLGNAARYAIVERTHGRRTAR